MVNPVMARSVKNQFQGAEASDDLFIAKEIATHIVIPEYVCVLHKHMTFTWEMWYRRLQTPSNPGAPQEGGDHETVLMCGVAVTGSPDSVHWPESHTFLCHPRNTSHALCNSVPASLESKQ